jgi:hypothetical protein
MTGGGRRWPLGLALLGVLAVIAVLPSAAWAQPVPAPPVTVDGPSSDIVALTGLSVARDGTGGLVYVKQVLGVPHVFVSRLVGGAFRAPEEIDAALIGGSSHPVIAAGNGGVLLVAFINGGNLYVVDRAGAAALYTAPIDLQAGASDPTIALSTFGKGYLAFTTAGAGGHDVRAAYYDNGVWALEASPLDAVPADDAGTGTGRPRVAAAGDGVGIVVWGEAGHIYSRRIWGTSPSLVFEQADVPSLGGFNEVTADQPSVGVGGDSSYVGVVFHEVLSNGSSQQSRVLMRRLRGSLFDNVTQPDGLSPGGADGAVEPQIVMSEYGRGFVTSARDDTSQVFTTLLGNNGAAGALERVDSLQNATPPDAVPAMAGLYSDLIAWQHDPGGSGTPEIRVRYSIDGPTLGPELVVSSPSLGPTDASSGLAAGGDGTGNAAVAWVQGAGSSRQIVVEQMYQPPGSFSVVSMPRYVRTAEPRLAWSSAREQWGVRYVVTIDGIQAFQTGATSVRVPTSLADGPHSWQVTAVNQAGLRSTTHPGHFWVDTVAPVARLTVTGKMRAGSVLHAYVSYTDSPPPELPAHASGIAEVLVRWGDGSSYKIRHGKFHGYRRAGRYKLTVVVLDRAGNTTTLVRELKIARKPPPKKRKPPKPPRRPAVHHSARR